MSNILDRQDELLMKIEKLLNLEPILPEYGLSEKDINRLGFTIPEMPNICFEDFNTEREKLPEFEYSLLPRWKVADIPVVVVIGFLGALISLGLHDVFDELHKNWGSKSHEKGGHGGQGIDELRGKKHRFKHGHDILNPFEIKWNDYFPDGTEATLLKKVSAWLKHLFQDTFSTEGIPFPGSSYFRDIINTFSIGEFGTYDTYKTFFTLKTRYTVGTAFVAAAMSVYVYGTEYGEKRKFFNYRYTSLTLGALVINICCGLSISLMTGDARKTTMNYSGVIAMIPYLITLFKVNKKLVKQLEQRNELISANQSLLINNRTVLNEGLHALNEFDQRTNEFISEIEENLSLSSGDLSSCLNECNRLIETQETWLGKLENELYSKEA
jgi:hypothetical protein